MRTALAGVTTFAAAPTMAEDIDESGFWKFSCYAYRDENRNGIFDIDDKPFAGLPLALRREDGNETVRFSNANGFANFSTSRTGSDDIDVRSAGAFVVNADIPFGWSATSGDGQTLRFRGDSVVPGGLTVEETCLPLGIAPDLLVEGAVLLPAGVNADTVRVSLRVDGGSEREIPVGADGGFRYSASPGHQLLAVSLAGSGHPIVRRFDVSNESVRLSVTDPFVPVMVGRLAENISFDDLVSPPGITEIPAGYGGLSWRNWIAVHNRFYEGPGYVNGTRSGEFVAYNSSGAPAEFAADNPFSFLGAHVAVAWPRGVEGDVVIRGWAGAILRHEERLRLSPVGGVFFDAAWAAVTRVEFSHSLHERIVVDDLQIAF